MHKTKADYLSSRFVEKNCFSAITTVDIDYMTVGTPVVVSVKPFAPRSDSVTLTYSSSLRPSRHSAPRPGQIMAEPPSDPRALRNPVVEDQSRDAQSQRGRNNVYMKDVYMKDGTYANKKPPTLSGVEKVSAEDLYKMSVVEANKMLRNGVKVDTMFVFSLYKDYHDFYIHGMQGQQVYFDSKKPLIFDEGHRFELERLTDVHKKDELNNFSEMIYSSLKDNRYINYSFGGVATSNKKYMFEDINIIFNDLKSVFPKNLSFFMSALSNGTLRSLVDTVSISFYRIQDVIAIFDSKKTLGMGVEIFLTNSAHKPQHMDVSEATATYRFLFSKSRENILTIDGELINRQHNKATNDALGSAFSVINKNIPIDDKLKKDKAKTISVE